VSGSRQTEAHQDTKYYKLQGSEEDPLQTHVCFTVASCSQVKAAPCSPSPSNSKHSDLRALAAAMASSTYFPAASGEQRAPTTVTTVPPGSTVAIQWATSLGAVPTDFYWADGHL
jgi:hypothetical protein